MVSEDQQNKKNNNLENPKNNKRGKSKSSSKKKTKSNSEKSQIKHAKSKQDQKKSNMQNKEKSKKTGKLKNNLKSAKHVEGKNKVKSKKEIRLEKLQKLRHDKKRLQIIKNVVACFLGVYLVGLVLFSFVCYPNTIIADTNLSFQTPDGAKKALIPNSGEYVFSADGFGFELQIEGKQIDYDFDVDTVVDRVFEYKNPIVWPIEIFSMHDFMTDSVVSFNRDKTVSIVTPAIMAHNEHAQKTQNADFVCDTVNKTVDIKEEVIGDNLKEEATLNSILGYIGSGRRHLALGDNEHVLPTLYADDERADAAIEGAERLLKSVMPLQMSTTVVSAIDYPLLSQWVHLREGYVAGLNDELLVPWIANLADQCDTLGKTRTFTTPYGKTCTVSGGDNIGWQIDQEGLFKAISAQAPKGETATIPVPCSSSLNGYGGPGSRDWGARYIDVDLSQQHARMYDDSGSLIWEADIVSGKPSTPTYTGIYTMKSKQSPSTLIGSPDPTTGQPSYRTTVQYWMGFEGNAIGFHDATWQPGFGGNLWLTIGSHGCVNLSYSAAQSLYGLCVSGDIVVVHN